MTDDDEVELGWITITKVLAPQNPAGVDIDVAHSDHLGVLEALGMLAAAQHIVWDSDESEPDGDQPV